MAGTARAPQPATFRGDPAEQATKLTNTEAEQCLLGALLVDNRAFERVVDILAVADFTNGLHGRIFQAIGDLIAAGRVANPVTLATMFSQDEALRRIGGNRYLAQLAESAVTIVNSPWYAATIADLARRRDIVFAAQDIMADALDLSDAASRSAIVVIAAGQQRLDEIEEVADRGGPEPVAAVAERTLRDIETAYKRGGLPTLDTGLRRLDDLVGGMEAGDLIVLGGRPGMGKSALACTLARNVAGRGKKTIYFSLEMARSELVQRWLAGSTGIATERQRLGNLDSNDMGRLIEAKRTLAALPILIDDGARLSVLQMRQRARRFKRRHGIDLMIVDHLQLIRQPGKAENRRLEIGDATSMLKAVAKELQIPVLLLSQLSRAVEGRDDKRPWLSDLRESGDIEADADVVLLLYREEYYLSRVRLRRMPKESDGAWEARVRRHDEEVAAAQGIAEIEVAKNRHGRTGMVKLAWSGERQRFETLARERVS